MVMLVLSIQAKLESIFAHSLLQECGLRIAYLNYRSIEVHNYLPVVISEQLLMFETSIKHSYKKQKS